MTGKRKKRGTEGTQVNEDLVMNEMADRNTVYIDSSFLIFGGVRVKKGNVVLHSMKALDKS